METSALVVDWLASAAASPAPEAAFLAAATFLR